MSRKDMKIKCAAVRHKGVVYEGRSHYEIMRAMKDKGIPGPVGTMDDDQGFVTDCGRYVRRAPALAIAICAGQVECGKTTHTRWLFSEDLPKETK
jgi:hypothetical protein